VSGKLHSMICEISSVCQDAKADMFLIYASYYEPVDKQVFLDDLNNKSHVLFLSDDHGNIRGFSTLNTWFLEHQGKRLQILYSGDTIIEQEYWGSQALSFSWIEFAGKIKSQSRDIPLYWFLITKGHRTYRYMSVFSKEFFPKSDKSTPEFVQSLMHRIGSEAFSDQYCKKTGVVMHRAESPALKKEFEGSRLINKTNKDIEFFVSKNPGYECGDELLCLCELSLENLRPMARKQFEKGLRQDVLEELT